MLFGDPSWFWCFYVHCTVGHFCGCFFSSIQKGIEGFIKPSAGSNIEGFKVAQDL